MSSLMEELEKLESLIALGRGKRLQELLRYLVERSENGNPPKESEIAIDVLGKEVDFNPSADPIVRVYVHKLRKKLEAFYLENESSCRLKIPVGSYRVELVSVEELPSLGKGNAVLRLNSKTRNVFRKFSLSLSYRIVFAVFSFAFILLGGLAVYWVKTNSHSTWNTLFGEAQVVTIAVGDFFTYREILPYSEMSVVVRNPSINSKNEFEQFSNHPESASRRYAEADLKYYNEGVVVAMLEIAKMKGFDAAKVNFKPASQLNADDFRSGPIFYIGLFKAMGELRGIVEGAEKYKIQGSASGLHDDFAAFAITQGPAKHRIVMLASYTDTGVTEIVKVFANEGAFNAALLSAKKINPDFDPDLSEDNFLILFRSQGIKRQAIDSSIIDAIELPKN